MALAPTTHHKVTHPAGSACADLQDWEDDTHFCWAEWPSNQLAKHIKKTQQDSDERNEYFTGRRCLRQLWGWSLLSWCLLNTFHLCSRPLLSVVFLSFVFFLLHTALSSVIFVCVYSCSTLWHIEVIKYSSAKKAAHYLNTSYGTLLQTVALESAACNLGPASKCICESEIRGGREKEGREEKLQGH